MITPAEVLEHCLAKPGAWADHPFDPVHPVVKVGVAPHAGKIFAFVNSHDVGVKAGRDRELADEWLRRHPDDARPMPYLARSGWNSLTLGGNISAEEIIDAVDESYVLVVSRLAKVHRPTGWEQ